jgi:hypothetical protein
VCEREEKMKREVEGEREIGKKIRIEILNTFTRTERNAESVKKRDR